MKKNTTLFVILGIIVVLFFWGCGSYNSLVKSDQNVKTKWSDVETNYQRRTNLYNSVVKVIEGSANFEKSTLTEIIQARAKATSVTVNTNDPKSLEAFQNAQSGLQSAFGRLLAVAENYPDLKTTGAFSDFQAQIEGTENRINVARQDYNNAVRNYNIKVKSFPGNIFAGIFGFHEGAFFKADQGTQNPPDIQFNIK
ncbi:MAG: LemA family protein [Chitinophagaceae bacterium]|nr:LemA family protein [Chitinophagaceae bacterium]